MSIVYYILLLLFSYIMYYVALACTMIVIVCTMIVVVVVGVVVVLVQVPVPMNCLALLE